MVEPLRQVYALVDPRDDVVCYVGITTRTPQTRFKDHWCNKNKGTHLRDAWLRELAKLNLLPRIDTLQKTRSTKWPSIEHHWIEHYRKISGDRLTNSVFYRVGGAILWTPESRAAMAELKRGNQNLLGHRHTAESRQKMSDARKGVPRPEFSKKMRGRTSPMKGRKHTPEARAKMSAARKGVARPDISELLRGNSWNRGKKRSAEQRSRQSQAMKGRATRPAGWKQTPEGIAKLSAAKRGNTVLHDYYLRHGHGATCRPETKEQCAVCQSERALV